jgi:hypothetical protein
LALALFVLALTLLLVVPRNWGQSAAIAIGLANATDNRLAVRKVFRTSIVLNLSMRRVF